MVVYRFEGDKVDIRDSLETLGFSDEVIEQGEVSKKSIAGLGFDPDVVAFMANLEGDATSFSPKELESFTVALELPEIVPQAVLMSGDTVDGDLAIMVLSYALEDMGYFEDDPNKYVLWREGPILSALFQEGLDWRDLVGIQISRGVAPDAWKGALESHVRFSATAESVEGLRYEFEGSGTIVSPQGHIVTAAHVADGFPEAISSISLYNKGIRHDVQSSELEVLYFDPNNDLAVIKISDLASRLGHSGYADIADKIPQGGTPMVHLGQTSNSNTPHFSVGTGVRKVELSNLRNDGDADEEYVSKMAIWKTRSVVDYGFSGGGGYVFKDPEDPLNSELELVSVTVTAANSSPVSSSMSIVDGSYSDVELEAVMEDIESAKSEDVLIEDQRSRRKGTSRIGREKSDKWNVYVTLDKRFYDDVDEMLAELKVLYREEYSFLLPFELEEWESKSFGQLEPYLQVEDHGFYDIEVYKRMLSID